ncbi:hypothetical protein QT986_09200 [Microcoleus sp. herbarium14]
MVFGTLVVALVRAALDEGLAVVLVVFSSALIWGFVNCLVAANTGIAGIVLAAVAIANSWFKMPYPVLSSHPGMSMSLAVFRRMFLICWGFRDGLASHIWEMVFVMMAAAIDVPCFGWVVAVSVVCGMLVGARMSKPSP